MIIYARELLDNEVPFSFIATDGTFSPEKDILFWLIENFGIPGDRWTYYYIIDYYPDDLDNEYMTCIAVDVAWDFQHDEDAFLFKMAWG